MTTTICQVIPHCLQKMKRIWEEVHFPCRVKWVDSPITTALLCIQVVECPVVGCPVRGNGSYFQAPALQHLDASPDAGVKLMRCHPITWIVGKGELHPWEQPSCHQDERMAGKFCYCFLNALLIFEQFIVHWAKITKANELSTRGEK